MIAADTSTWIAFLQEDGGADVKLLDWALRDRQVLIDRGIPLLTRDRDFRAFAGAAGLDLVIGTL